MRKGSGEFVQWNHNLSFLLGTADFEYKSEESRKWVKFTITSIDVELLKLNVTWGWALKYIGMPLYACFQKRLNFSSSLPTSKEGVLRLLSAPSSRFRQQTAVCPVLLWALVASYIRWTEHMHKLFVGLICQKACARANGSLLSKPDTRCTP